MPGFLDDVDWAHVRWLAGRVLRYAGFAAAGLSALLVAMLVLGLLALQIGPVRSAIGARVIALLGEGDGLTIEIEDYRGIWPVTFGADRILVRDGGEMIAEIKDVDFSWAPIELLSGTLHITLLEAGQVTVLALPEGEDTPDGSAPGPLIPSLPVAVVLDRLALPKIDLAAGVAGEAAVALSAEGRAALTGGRADLALKARRRDAGNFSLDALLAYAPGDETLAFDVTLVDGEAGAPGVVAAITGDAALEALRIRASGDGPVDDWRGTGEAQAGTYGAVTFTAGGSRRAGEFLDIEARFTPGAALADVPGPVVLTARASRQDATYLLNDLSLSAGDARFEGRLEAEDPLRAPHLLLEGSLLEMGVLAGNASLPPRLAIALDVTGEETFSRFDVAHMRLSAPGQQLSFEGRLDLDPGVVSGTLLADVEDVLPLAQLAGTTAAGSLTGRLEIARATFAGAVDAVLEARFQPVALPDDRLVPLLGADLRVTAQVSDAAGEGSRIDSFALVPASGAFDLSAEGLISPSRADLQVRLDAAQLAPFSGLAGTSLSGSGSVAVHLTGPFDALTADASVTLNEARAAGIEVAGTGSAKLKLAPDLTGPVTFVGSVAGAPAELSLMIAGDGGETQIRDIAATLLDMRITGGLTLGQGGAMTAQIEGDVSSLAALGRVAGLPMRGSGRFTFASVPGDTGNRLVAEAVLRRVEAAGLTAGNVTLRGGLAADQRVTARLQLRAVTAAHVSSSETVIDLSGTPQRLAIVMDVKNLDTYEDARGSGTLLVKALYDAAASTLTLNELNGRLAGLPLALRSPAAVAFGRGLKAGPVVLEVGEGAITATFTQGPGSMEADLAATALPLRFLAAAAGQSSVVRGTLEGQAALSTNGSKGSGSASFAASPRVPGDRSDIPDIQLDAQWDGSNAKLSVASDAPGTDDLAITASLPLRARGGVPQMPPEAALEARMLGNLDVGAFWPLVPVDGHRMLGVVALDVAARGPLDDLEIAGTAAMRDGLYENFDTGLLLSPLNVDMDASTSGGTLTVNARDGETGTMTGSGKLDLSDEADERLDVSLKLSSFRIARRDEVHATASGDIGVLWPRGPGGEPQPVSIRGTITVEKVDAVIPDQLASDVTTIDVTKVTAEGQPLEPETPADDAAPGDGPSGIELDVTVDVPRQAFVRGRGLESEWMGSLVVTGTPDTPSVRGAFQVVRGTFDFLGQTFDLTGGRIEFTGGREVDPYLDVKAVYEDDDFQAVVAVTGLSSNPDIALSSLPPLPRDEILARILFGTGTGQLSALQAVQLAQAAAALSGISGGSGGGVLDAMRRSLGVDVLSVGDQGVEVGSYVRDGVYVGVSQGLEAGSGQVSVEVELTNDISVESDVGAAGDTTVGVTWERDY